MSKQEWLYKQGINFKTWKRRFFVLDGNMLKYSKTEKSTKPQGVINLAQSTNVDEIVLAKFPSKASFSITTPTRTYYLVAETEDSRTTWMKVIKAIIQTNNIAGSAVMRTVVEPEDFELLKVVGKGSFGKVMQVRYKKNQNIYAMKVLSKQHIIDNNEIEHTMAEKATLAAVHHPFLVNLHFAFQTTDKLYLILDFMNGGELFFHLQNDSYFDPKRAQFYGAEILLAIEALHNAGIIYRDLKPENLLLSYEGHICITDFGLSKHGLAVAAKTNTFCGTPEYLAPEVLLGEGYGFEVDWWSFGSLIFEMLTGFPPFFSEEPKEMYKKIMSAPIDFPEHVPADAQDLIAQLLHRDPKQRLIDPVLIKKHDFFKGIDWDLLFQKKIPPPFVPEVRDLNDVSQIDPSFTEEKPTTDVIVDDKEVSELGQVDEDLQKDFAGFTYMEENEEKKSNTE